MEILENSNEYDFYWKILLLGAGQVGKSAFRKRINYKNNYNEFIEDQKNLFFYINLDFHIIYIKYLNRIFKLKIFDNAGQERFRTFTHNYLKLSSIYLIFYDAFNRESFNTLKDYSDKILSIDEKRIIIIVRSKYELNLEYTKNNIDIVSDEEVFEYINNKNINNNIFFFHLSNYEKYGSGINNLLEFLIIKSIKKNLKCDN